MNVTIPGTLSSLLTIEQKRSVIQLKVTGFINEEDIKTIRNQLMVLEVLDLTETDITILPEDSFCYPGRSHGKLSLRKIILPNSCIEIGKYAFYGCFNLEEVYAPMVTRIQNYAFWYCENIQQLTVKSLSESIGYQGINRPIKNLIISNYATNAYIPRSSSWDYYHLYLPNTIIDIFGSACYGLRSITFEEGYNSYLLDLNGTNIEQIEIPKNAAGMSAGSNGYFWDCPYLKTVIIPENWINNMLPYNAFRKCPRLQTFICKKQTPPTIQSGTNVFEDTPIYACNLYVPAESINLYRTATGWKDFGTILPLEE